MNKNEKNLTVSYAPHIRSEETIRSIMLDVIIALIPIMIAGSIIMGYRALCLMAVCAGSAVGFEYLWSKIIKKPSPTDDLSAVVTGLLLSMCLPVTMPFWMVIIGTMFAIIIVKQFFGGLGNNFLNPALAGRVFLFASWSAQMTTWSEPFSKLGLFRNVDVVTTATPLALMKSSTAADALSQTAVQLPDYWSLFIGTTAGSIGETSALAILIGFGYLVFRKIISVKTPLLFIGTVSVIVYIFGGRGMFNGDIIYHVLSGGLLLCAVFMATEYTTTPVTPLGTTIFAVGCGVITAVIRLWGDYPEGVSYAVLIMNTATPLIDKYTRPKSFGQTE